MPVNRRMPWRGVPRRAAPTVPIRPGSQPCHADGPGQSKDTRLFTGSDEPHETRETNLSKDAGAQGFGVGSELALERSTE